MALDFPNSPAVNQTFQGSSGSNWQWDGVKWMPVASGAVGFVNMPASVQQSPVTFPYAGKPAASARVNVPIAMAITIAANLAGSVAYATTATTADATFTLNKISGGSTTALGTIVLHAVAAATFAGAGGSLAAGDVLQMIAPGTQDTTLADVGLTIMTLRT